TLIGARSDRALLARLHDVRMIEPVLIGRGAGENRRPSRDVDDFRGGLHTCPGSPRSHLCDIRKMTLLTPPVDQICISCIQTNKEKTLFASWSRCLDHRSFSVAVLAASLRSRTWCKNFADQHFAPFPDRDNSGLDHGKCPQIVFAACFGNFSLHHGVPELV